MSWRSYRIAPLAVLVAAFLWWSCGDDKPAPVEPTADQEVVTPVVEDLTPDFGAAVGGPGPTGAIFTTTPDGGIVNENVRYQNKLFVYLDGGPPPNAPPTSAGLDDGLYVFQVTDPSGWALLSSDPAKCRVIEVAGGVITRLVPPSELGLSNDYTQGKGSQKGTFPCHVADPPNPIDPAGPDDAGPSGHHDTNVDTDHGPPAIVVQLMPFENTPNPGGVYKAWITPIETYVSRGGDLDASPMDSPIKGRAAKTCPENCFENDPGFGPPRSVQKTDNFKVKEVPPRIKVFKFEDVDGDGIKDPDEPEITGWTVCITETLFDGTEITNCLPTPVDRAVEPGATVTVTEIFPDDSWEISYVTIDEIYVDPPTVSVEVVFAPGDLERTVVFGNTQPGEVHGKKVIDLNADGDISSDICPLDPDPWGNNAGCQGVEVILAGTDNKGNSVQVVTTTDANGEYSFTDIWPGSYTITISEPDGFFCSYPDPCNYTVDILSGDVVYDVDFGDYSLAEIKGRKVIDIFADGPSGDDTCPLDPDPWGNNAGCQGVEIELWDNGTLVASTKTDNDGYFEFTDLMPGNYSVKVVEPEGFFCSYPDPCEFDLELVSDEIADGLVFGDYSKAEIHGRKVIDLNADGDISSDACPLDPDPWGNNDGCQGVVVELWDGGTKVAETVTDANGYYSFTDLMPGIDYTVKVVEPEGFFCSYPTPCEHSTGKLMSDEHADNLNFGDFSKAEIYALKFLDLDEDGQQDAGEGPLEGVEFCLYQGAVMVTGSCKYTGPDGMVGWTDLMPGTYTVLETLPDGWYSTTGTSITVTLISDEIRDDLLFGNVFNCVGLTPGYWVNWDNHYTEAQFLTLLEGTIAEGDIDLANWYLTSIGCDDGDALHCMRRFLLANQLTLNLTQHPELPNPSGGSMFRACQVPGTEGNLGSWLDDALEIHDADGVGFSRDWILTVKNVLDWFANLSIIVGW